MASPVTTALERALAALQDGALDDAYSALLAAWAETRDARVASLLTFTALQARVRPTWSPGARSTTAEREARWAADLQACSDLHRAPIIAARWPWDMADLLGRAQLLAAATPDPRVGAVVADWLIRPPPTLPIESPRGDRVIRAMLKLLARHGAPADAARVLAHPHVRDWCNALDERADPGPPVDLDDASAQALSDLLAWRQRHVAELRTRASTGEALREMVYQAPTDMDLRAVVGDALTAAGDPQGELITLQLRELPGPPFVYGEPSAATRKRAKALLVAHKSGWSAPFVGPGAKPVLGWEAGFPSEGTWDWLPQAAPITTFRSLWARYSPSPSWFASQPALPRLEELGLLNPDALRAAGSAGIALRRLGLLLPSPADVETALGAFSALQTLFLDRPRAAVAFLAALEVDVLVVQPMVADRRPALADALRLAEWLGAPAWGPAEIRLVDPAAPDLRDPRGWTCTLRATSVQGASASRSIHLAWSGGVLKFPAAVIEMLAPVREAHPDVVITLEPSRDIPTWVRDGVLGAR